MLSRLADKFSGTLLHGHKHGLMTERKAGLFERKRKTLRKMGGFSDCLTAIDCFRDDHTEACRVEKTRLQASLPRQEAGP